MAKPDWRSEVRLTADVDADERRAAKEVGDDRPFVIAVLGDFQGVDRSAPRDTLAFLDVDRDNFDEVLARCNVRWEGRLNGLPGHAEAQLPVQLTFRELDDFHPDRIIEQVVPLRLLVETRRGLDDPSRFDRVAAQVLKWAAPAPTGAPATAQLPVAAQPRPDLKPSELLDLILEQPSERPVSASTAPQFADLQRFLEQVVGPHLVKIDSARQAALIDAVDQALSQQVRAVLHHPVYQRLEAAWRSLHWLVSSAETGSQLKIRILQFTRQDLRHDLGTGAALEESQLARLCCEPRLDPPTLLVGNYEFGSDTEDLELLDHVARIAEVVRAPFVAAASPALLGCSAYTAMPSAAELARRFQHPAYRDWHRMRRSAQARWLSLALPRVLSRLPYGSNTDPTRAFAFQEHVTAGHHERLLWGNPAFAVAAVVAGAFAADSWSLDLSKQVYRLEGLPLYVYDDEGTAVTAPCAEVLLSEPIVEALEMAGLTPLVSYRDADAVALSCVQSLAEPRAPIGWR